MDICCTRSLQSSEEERTIATGLVTQTTRQTKLKDKLYRVGASLTSSEAKDVSDSRSYAG